MGCPMKLLRGYTRTSSLQSTTRWLDRQQVPYRISDRYVTGCGLDLLRL